MGNILSRALHRNADFPQCPSEPTPSALHVSLPRRLASQCPPGAPLLHSTPHPMPPCPVPQRLTQCPSSSDTRHQTNKFVKKTCVIVRKSNILKQPIVSVPRPVPQLRSASMPMSQCPRAQCLGASPSAPYPQWLHARCLSASTSAPVPNNTECELCESCGELWARP